MGHAEARLTVHGCLVLVQRVAAGGLVVHVAKELGISRQCAHRWGVRRFREEGVMGLTDRSSRQHHTSFRTPADAEDRVIAARTRLGLPRFDGQGR